jgi:hypothetical protein
MELKGTHIAKRASVEATSTIDELIEHLHDTILTTSALRPHLRAIIVVSKLPFANKVVFSL